jgi:hypothetical protein
MMELSQRRCSAVLTQRYLWLEDANPLASEETFMDGSPIAMWREQAAIRAQKWAASARQSSRTELEGSSVIEHDGPPYLQSDFISRASEVVAIKMATRKQRDKEAAELSIRVYTWCNTKLFYQSGTTVKITLSRTIELRREDDGYIADTEEWYSSPKQESITRKKHSARRYKSPCPKDCTTGQKKYVTFCRDSVDLIRHKTEKAAKRKQREDAVRKYVCCEYRLSSGYLSEIEEEVRKLGWWGRMMTRGQKLMYRNPKSM